MYTLAGLDNTQLGWGRRDETWSFMETLTALGGEDWFRLGDRDLAVHVERTRRLARGETLAAITADFCRRLGVGPRVLPMTDDPVRTRLRTAEGWLDFQDYFVRLQCRPVVQALAFAGGDQARAHPDLLAALGSDRLRAVIICPSNPFISVEPILAVPGVRAALAACPAPVVAVSPIIGGRAVKGPTAKMMAELGMTPSAAAVARRYGRSARRLHHGHGGCRRGRRPGSARHPRRHPDDQPGRPGRPGAGGARRRGRDPRGMSGIWAVLPIKDLTQAKQRLAARLTPGQRQALAAIMAEDVLDALAAVPQLAGIPRRDRGPGRGGVGATVWRAGRHGGRSRRAHGCGDRGGAAAGAGGPCRHDRGAGRYPADCGGRNHRPPGGTRIGARLHDHAGA